MMFVNFDDRLVYSIAISYILWPFGILCGQPFGIFCGHFGMFFRVLVCCARKNLATLLHT
jgi:hypothetical protein